MILLAAMHLSIAAVVWTCFTVWPQTWSSSHHTIKPEFGIGFDLTPSYGTAAIARANGTRTPLAHINGTATYLNVLFKLSLTPDQRARDPSLVIPDTEIIPALAEMLTALRSAASAELGRPITAGAVTVPHLPVLSDLPLKAAFFLSGMEYIEVLSTPWFGRRVVHHEHAVLAGHGRGLCRPYTAPPNGECFENLPMRAYYIVGYYADALEIVIVSPTRLAYQMSKYPYINAELGYAAKGGNADEEFYWEEVRRWLGLPLGEFDQIHPDLVMVNGAGSGAKKFREVLDGVLDAFFGENEKTKPKVVDDGVDPVFAGAMGAAEFVLRKPYWDERWSVKSGL